MALNRENNKKKKYILKSNYFIVSIFCFENTNWMRPYGLNKYDFKLHSFLVIQEWESILNSKSWILYLVRKGYSSTRNLFHWEIYSPKSFPISKIQKDSYLLLLFRNSLTYSRVKLCGKVHTHEKYTSWQKHWVNPVCNIPLGIIIIMKTSLEMSHLHTHIDF